MHRQAAPMAQATVAAQVHQPLDVHRNFTPQVALDAVILVDQLAQLQHFVVRKLIDPAVVRNAQLRANVHRVRWADAIDVTEADQHPLVGRNVHAGNTGHAWCSWSCRCAAAGRTAPAGWSRPLLALALGARKWTIRHTSTRHSEGGGIYGLDLDCQCILINFACALGRHGPE